MCQAAVSNTVAQDEAKLAAVLKVLEAVYSAEGQSKMAVGAAVLSYPVLAPVSKWYPRLWDRFPTCYSSCQLMLTME